MLSTTPSPRYPMPRLSDFDFLLLSCARQSTLPAARPGPFRQTGNQLVSSCHNVSYVQYSPPRKARKGPVFDASLFLHSPLRGVHLQTRQQPLSFRAWRGAANAMCLAEFSPHRERKEEGLMNSPRFGEKKPARWSHFHPLPRREVHDTLCCGRQWRREGDAGADGDTRAGNAAAIFRLRPKRPTCPNAIICKGPQAMKGRLRPCSRR